MTAAAVASCASGRKRACHGTLIAGRRALSCLSGSLRRCSREAASGLALRLVPPPEPGQLYCPVAPMRVFRECCVASSVLDTRQVVLPGKPSPSGMGSPPLPPPPSAPVPHNEWKRHPCAVPAAGSCPERCIASAAVRPGRSDGGLQRRWGPPQASPRRWPRRAARGTGKEAHAFSKQ